MAHLRVPSTAAGFSLQRPVWLPHGGSCCLRAPPGDPQTWFAFSFVDESSRHSIPVGLDLAAFGAQCMFCGDAGQLRPYSAITLLASKKGEKGETGGKVTAKQIAWPQSEHFANLNVHLDEGPRMQYGDAQRFATSSVLKFVLYRTRCTVCVLT